MNNPTIVSAALSDKELQDSINRMVANFDKGLQTMLEHSNEYVGKIQASLQKIGDTNFGAKGSNDGGIAKQTKAQNEFTDAVKKSTSEIKRQGKEAAMSFDQIAAAQQKAIQQQGDSTLKKSFNRQELQQYIDRLRELQAEYIKVNTQQGGGVRSDKIKADMRNLEELIAKYREILRNIDYVNSRQGTIDVKKWVQDLGAVDDRYKKLVRWYTVLEKEDQRRIASEEKANQKRLADLEKEKAAQDKVIKSYQDSVLKAEFGKVMKMPTKNIDEIRTKFERLSSIIANIRELGILSPEKISAADSEVKKLGASIQRYEKFEQERIAAEQKFIVEQAKEVEQTQTLEGRVRELAKAAREYLKADNDGRWSTSAYGKGLTIYAENDARAKGLSIEEQIARQLQVEKEMILQQATAAQQLNSERKKYVSPTSYEIRDAANNVIANKLGIKNNQVVNANIYSDSIKRVTAEYKQLQDTISKMDTYERNSPIGRYMIQRMQELERQTQRTRAELSRPISLQAAKGISETTLDDMVYKLRQLQSYKMGLNVKTQVDEMKQVDKEIVSLKKRYDELMGKNQQMIASNTALGRSWNYMKNRLAFYFSVGASTQFVKNLIEVRSQYEMNERALGILINSAERGTQIFNELSQMALVSPYTLIELSSAAKQLTAYDVAARDVVDTTRRLADMAAAVGIPIERLTYALGQIKAYGYLNSRDARMFANAGIPLVKQLSDYYTELEGKLVSTADVYDRIKKKAIDYNEVMEVINKMTDEGGKFFDFQAKMADTLKVRLANLTLAWNNMLNDMGKETQGLLTWGIGALRELFLHWKQLDSLIKNAAWALGIRTALMFIVWSALKAGNALGVMSKQMALSAVFGTKLANVLKNVGHSVAALAKSRWTWISLFAIAAVEATQALFGVNEAQKALNESIRNGAKDNYDNISKFLEQYKEVRDSLYKTVTKPVPNGMLNVQEWTDSQGNKWHNVSREYTETLPQDIDKNEAQKSWEAVREQIELTVASSDKYIGNLLSISNMSERVRQGFNLLDDVQVVNAALKELDDDTIKVSKDMSAWWNAWQAPDGLIGNLKDLVNAENELIETYGSVEAAKKGGGKLYTDYEKRELANFRDDLRETTNSIINFIELKGWSGNEGKINQVFEQITQKLVLDNQLDPQKAFKLQTEVEEARSKVAKQALLQRINDERAALKIAHDDSVREALAADVERYKNWDETNGRSKVEWERFTKWLKEQHISETTAMFRNMDAEDIKSLNFQEGKHAEWVTRMVTQYAKEHKMSYDEAFKYLKSWVRSANQWSIYIPLTISTEDKKSVYDQLGEYDKAVDEADAQIERLTKRINELNAKKKKSKEETQELANAEQELADAQKAKADAEAKGGHGKKEKKDEKAANKAAKQAESELQKALKDELSTIDKVRSIYKDLTKEGMSHADAVERATSGWDETVNAINKVLQKNGLQKLNLTKFAGISNPRKLVDMLQSQLDILVKRGAKATEIKELQTKIQTLNVDADKYDLTRITKGLNSELDKLKDEYELAVELDADPELGNMFTDMFGIDTTDFPKTIDEYMNRAQQEFDKMRKKRNFSAPLNIFKAGDKEWEEWGRQVGLVVDVLDENGNVIDKNTDALDKLTPKFKEAQGVAKKWAQDTIKATKDLEYELGDLAKKVEMEEAKLAVLEDSAANETNAAQKHLLELQIQRQKEAIEKLKMESIKLLPFYEDLFGDMYNVSVGRLKEIAKAAKEVMSPRQGDSGVGYTQRTDSKGKVVYDIFAKDKQGDIKKTTISLEEFIKINKQIDSVQQKVAESSPWEKIKDSFSKKEGGGIKNFASGMEALGGELQKVANITKEIGGFAEALGADENTIEIINDIATSIGGVATAAQGIGQIASGDYIGGAASVLSGAFSAISTWFDNSDKKIVAQIQESERAVKRLETSYKNLEYTISQAYGMATIGANKAAIANKELQLVELKRQLSLEQSRDGKHRDEDAIESLRSQIFELEHSISDMMDNITNDLLGISSVADAATSFMDDYIEALRSGEDANKVFSQSINDMIANMVKKMLTTKIIQPWFEEQWNTIQNEINRRGESSAKAYEEAQRNLDRAKQVDLDNADSVVEALRSLGKSDEEIYNIMWGKDGGKNQMERLVAAYQKSLIEAERNAEEISKQLAKDTEITVDDIRRYAELWRTGQPMMEEKMQAINDLLQSLGVMNDDLDSKNLSALQQGIQSVTEDTAGAIEAYMNIVAQRVFEQNQYLQEIRNCIVSFDLDVQLGTLSQMLLQLQQSYIVQQNIEAILNGVLNPSGRAIMVELNS